jgi:hypothetical protein
MSQLLALQPLLQLALPQPHVLLTVLLPLMLWLMPPPLLMQHKRQWPQQQKQHGRPWAAQARPQG